MGLTIISSFFTKPWLKTIEEKADRTLPEYFIYNTIAQAIIHFYSLFEKACIDIGKDTYNKDWFDRCISTEQNYVDAFIRGQNITEIESVEEYDRNLVINI